MLGTREGPRLTSSPVPQRLADALRDFRVRLGLVAVLALVVRLAWVWGYGRTQEVAGDQLFYHLQGLALAQGDGFVNPYAWNDPVTPLEIPTAAHPPLYSLYLALWSLLGFETALEHRVVSVFLGVACVVVVGLVGRRLAGERAGIVAAIAAAIYANLWINDGLLAAESVYALAVLVVLLTAYRFWDEPGWSRAAVLGVAGVGSLILPSGQRIPLDKPVIIIGRLPECDVSLSDPNVSRRHTEVRSAGTGFFARDLGSTNGTMVNGLRLHSDQPLNDGDILSVGGTHMRFEAL